MMTPSPPEHLTLLLVRMPTTSLSLNSLDSKLKTNFTAQILSDIGSASASLKAMKKSISFIDRQLMLEEAGQHQSVCLVGEVNWLRVWEAAKDRGRFWTNISQSFF